MAEVLAKSMTTDPERNWSPVATASLLMLTLRWTKLLESTSAKLTASTAKATAADPVSAPVNSVKVAVLSGDPLAPNRMVGKSLTAVTLMVLVTKVLVLAPSLTAQLMVLVGLVAVGASLELLNFTVRRAAWYSAVVAVPVSDKMPVPLLNAPVILVVLVNPKTSPLVSPPVMLTVAEAKLALSWSVTVIVLSITAAVACSV